MNESLEAHGRALAALSGAGLCDRGFEVEKAVKWAVARVVARGLRVTRVALSPDDFGLMRAEFDRRGQSTGQVAFQIATASGRTQVTRDHNVPSGEFDIRFKLETPGEKRDE